MTSPISALALPSSEEVRKVRQLAATVSKAALEVLGGTRQVQQLSRLLGAEAFQILERRTALTLEARESPVAAQQKKLRSLHQSPQIRSVRGCRVSPGIYELSVVAADRCRYRAIAVRIEQDAGSWLVTVLQIG